MKSNHKQISILIFCTILILSGCTAYHKFSENPENTRLQPKKIPIQMQSEKAVLSESIKKIKEKGYPENITDTFSSDDSEIIASVKLMNLSGKHNIKWDWIAPDNSLYYSTGNKSINAPDNKYFKEITAFHSLGVKGNKAAAYPGKWKVNIYLNDKNIAAASFKLGTAASVDDLTLDKPKTKRGKTQMRFEKVVLSESIRKIRGKGYPENITDTFSSDDSEIIASIKLINLSGKHNIKWDWIAPDNSLYYSTGNKSINAPGGKYLKEVTALHRLGVRGKRGVAYPGAWKVNIYLDDKNIATAFFKLEAAASVDDLFDDLPEDRPKPKRAKTRLFDDW